MVNFIFTCLAVTSAQHTRLAQPTSNLEVDRVTPTDILKVRKCLGKGACGEVFETHDTEENINVAVKECFSQWPADEKGGCNWEAEKTKQCQGPGVIIMYESVKDRPTSLVFEIAQWGDLFEACKKNAFRDYFLRGGEGEGEGGGDRIMSVIYDLMQGLKTIQNAGIIHSDIKEENVVAVQDESGAVRFKLTDFGLAHPQSEADRLYTQYFEALGPVNMVRCTPSALPPEILRYPIMYAENTFKSRLIDYSLDQWGAGIVLYNFLMQLQYSEEEDIHKYLFWENSNIWAEFGRWSEEEAQQWHARKIEALDQFDKIPREAREIVADLLRYNWEDRAIKFEENIQRILSNEKGRARAQQNADPLDAKERDAVDQQRLPQLEVMVREQERELAEMQRLLEEQEQQQQKLQEEQEREQQRLQQREQEVRRGGNSEKFDPNAFEFHAELAEYKEKQRIHDSDDVDYYVYRWTIPVVSNFPDFTKVLGRVFHPGPRNYYVNIDVRYKDMVNTYQLQNQLPNFPGKQLAHPKHWRIFGGRDRDAEERDGFFKHIESPDDKAVIGRMLTAEWENIQAKHPGNQDLFQFKYDIMREHQ